MFCVKRKKKSVSCETSTQIDSNLNFAPDEQQSTGSFPKIVTPALALGPADRQMQYRHLFLIRHGRFWCKESMSEDLDQQQQQQQQPPFLVQMSKNQTTITNAASSRSVGRPVPKEGSLSVDGARQLEATGRRLKSLKIPFDGIYSSDLPRAKESGVIIANILQMGKEFKVDPILAEGTFPSDKHPVGVQPSEVNAIWENFQARKRFEEAYYHYTRKPSKKNEDTFEILVIHCNIIKFFVHKALGLNGLGLRKFSNAWFPAHGSITVLSFSGQGHGFLRCLGDCGHLDLSLITVNNINKDIFWSSWMQEKKPKHEVDSNWNSNRVKKKSESSPTLRKFETVMLPLNSRKKKKEWMKVTYKDYKKCCGLVTNYIRSQPEKKIRASSLCQWLFEQKSIFKENDVQQRTELVTFVINRLVTVDFILRQEEEGEEEEEEEERVSIMESGLKKNDILFVHPLFKNSIV